MRKVKEILMCLTPILMTILLSIFLELAVYFLSAVTGFDLYSFFGTHLTFYLVTYHLLLLGVSWLWYYFSIYRYKRQKKSESAFTVHSLGGILLLAFSASLFISFYLLFLGILLPDLMNGYDTMIEDSGLMGLGFLSTLSTLIIAPVAEELFFRGLTFRYARQAGAGFMLANFIQALLFGIYHMNLVQGSYAFLLGLILGWIYKKYKSIPAAILFHSCFNFCGTYLSAAVSLLPQTVFVNGCILAVGLVSFAVALKLIRKDTGHLRTEQF